MSAWMVSRVCASVGLLMTVAGFVLGMVAIWLQYGPLGGMAALSGLPGLILTGGTALYISDEKPRRPERPLPRKERRRIAGERARIEADREIARLEREAGLS